MHRQRQAVAVLQVRCCHSPRNAAVIGNRAAHTAGSRPPTNPSSSAQVMPSCSSRGVTAKANATCEYEVALSVDAL